MDAQADVDDRSAADPPAAGWSTWSGARLARLGFLVGLGLNSSDVARDPKVASTAAAVRAQARRFGLTFRAVSGVRLPYAILTRYEAAAARRRLACDDLLRLVLIKAGSDDALIDNILDD